MREGAMPPDEVPNAQAIATRPAPLPAAGTAGRSGAPETPRRPARGFGGEDTPSGNRQTRFPQDPGRERLGPGPIVAETTPDAPMAEMTLALLLFLLPLAYSPGPGNMVFAAIGGRFGLRASLTATTGYHFATFAVTALIGLGFSGLAGMSPILFDLLRYGGAAYVFWLALGFLRAGATTGTATATAQQATAMDGAILLLLNPKAYVIIALMFTQFLPVTGASDPGLVVWITAVFTLNNLLAFTVWTLAGDLLMRRFRSASGARPMNLAFGVLLAAVALWMLLR